MSSAQQACRKETDNWSRWETNPDEPLPWRYEPRDIELGVLLEDAVFEACQAIFQLALQDLARVRILTPSGAIKSYHYVDLRVDRSEQIQVNWPHCIPPIPADATRSDRLRILRERRHAQQVTSLALPVGRSTDPLIGAPPLPMRLAPEQTRDRWRATDVSQRLRATEGQFDLLFEDFALSPRPLSRYLDYHWVSD